MKINIVPISTFVAGRGMVPVSILDVTVGRYDLGNGAQGNYSLTALDLTDPKNPREYNAASGTVPLTAEQFAAWGADDNFFAACVAKNIGLVPA